MQLYQGPDAVVEPVLEPPQLVIGLRQALNRDPYAYLGVFPRQGYDFFCKIAVAGYDKPLGLAKWLGLEFATAATHNTYYFHKFDNGFKDSKAITTEFKRLVAELLKSNKPKDWFRAYFNYGLINFINGKGRLLPCEMGTDVFFMDPFGEIYPCNGMNWSMGNIKKQSFDEIWNSPAAKKVRENVSKCDKGCWMIGSASPAIKKDKMAALKWIAKSKIQGVDYSCVE